MKRILFIGLLINIMTVVSAEGLSLTVDQAVLLAVENNLNLQSAAIDVGKMERAKNKAWNVFIPSVNGSLQLGHNQSLLSDPDPSIYSSTDPYWRTEAGLSLSLPLNASAATGIKQTIIDFEEGRLGYEDTRKQLERDVRKQFYSLIAAAANIDLKKVNIDIAVKRYEQARENYNNGLISELDMLQAQVSAENEKPELNSLMTQYENNLMNLKLHLGIPLTDTVNLIGDLDSIRFYNLDTKKLIESYSAGRMDIIQINKKIESLENTRRLQAQYNRTPTLSLFSTWGTEVNDSFESENWESGTWVDSLSMGIQLAVPLDDLLPSSRSAQELKDLDDSIRILEIQKQQLYEAAAMEITNLVMTLENSRHTIETYALNVDLAEKSFNLTTEAYNLGTRELLDVETAQESLMTASQNVLTEKINYITNLLDLQYAINTEDLSAVLEER
jgi:outer membrane protein TolC